MNGLGKHILKGKLRIITPVHIGGAQEKHLMKGLDYINKGSTIYFLDEKKLMAYLSPEQYCNALANNNLVSLINNSHKDVSEFSSRQAIITGEVGTDIKINIKNTLSNKPIIPGSSLKGALRSMLYNLASNGNVVPEKDASGRPKNMEQKFFGRISDDMFRYMIVNDIEFNSSKFINTKTYNLKNINTEGGGWKHELRGNTTSQFSEKGFTFPLEIIAQEDFGEFEIVFNQKSFDTAKKNSLVVANSAVSKIFNGETDFYNAIKAYTEKHLNAEIAFFKKYKGEHSEKIVAELNRLLSLNQDAPLLRLGLGSGFHSMTGDTLHESHLIDFIAINGNRTRGKLNRQDSAKSRKLAFEKAGQSYQFYPMGFVQLCTEEYFASIEKKLQEQKEKKEEQIKRHKAVADHARIESEKAKAEALKPIMIEVTTLKKAKWVDGIVIGQNGKMLRFKPFVKGFEDKIYEINYASGMPVDTIIQVLCESRNGQILQFQGSPKAKA